MAEAVGDDDLDRLIAAHLDDALAAADATRLQERLRHDADARRLLLAAATQASALPRLGLEVALPRFQLAAAPRRRWWLPVAAAAALMIGVVAWWSSATAVAVRVTGGVVERAGVSQPAGSALRRGDRFVSGAAPAVLSWPDEDTRLDLAAGSRLQIEELGLRKVVRLDQGGLEAAVAPQPAAGGLVIVTPHGRVEVVGTRFSVQVQEHGSTVAVTHGRVRLSPSSGGTPVMIEAGYAAELTPGAISTPGPAMVLPPVAAAKPLPTATAPSIRITAADFTAGSEGRVAGGVVHGVPIADGRVTRLTTPSRPSDGYARLGEHLRCTLRLSVDQPTTLAVLLVCDHPEGQAIWAGNLQAERVIPAGTHEIVLTRADLRPTTGAVPAVGSRVVAVAVMCWGAAADLGLEWLAFSE
jgi:ferric-dicitrate binding protein FerR (iron transport regulator)